MPIKFSCGKCGQELNVKDEMAGKQGKCPACKAAITVPSASRSASAVTRKRSDDVDDAEILEDDDDDRPRKKRRDDDDDDDRPRKKRRDDDDDDDDRPRKKRRDDDDDDDDRPRKKRRDDDDDDDERPRKKRRDDDDDDYDDRPKQNPKQRRAAFKRAALGVFLSSIGMWVTIGAFGASILMVLVMMVGAKGDSKTLFDIMKILGYLLAAALFAGVVLRIVGSSLTIMTPGKIGELAFAIACTATAGLSGVMMLILMLKFFDSSGGFGGVGMWMVSLVEFDPFSGMAPIKLPFGGFGGGIKPTMGDASFTAFLLPILEVSWLVLFSLYQWSVGKSTKDREERSKGMLMVIVAPSTCAAIGLLMLILFKAIDFTNIYVPMMFNALHLMVIGGLLCWQVLVMMGLKSTLQSAK